ncbi:MAG: DNA polymerase I [Bacilli bacterium]|nr:DNA polymerase I [Bacilli bacterium]
MKKLILVDGNNLIFRSYYATAYNGNLMKNSKEFPTNALYGFINMINKIIEEEKPEYMIVAFDKGKTFRHEKYAEYKAGRISTPDELKMQMPVAKEILTLMGIKYLEIDNYEADDIIGTFAKFCDEEEDFIGTIISSDKDLLQLISNDVDIKLLKQKDYIRYNFETFKEEYGIDPINIIDLKALMGDSSDNIPGVKGIGEKTALKLLHEYKTLDGIYDNIDNIKGSLNKKLIDEKENAYKSYELATIYKEVPLDINIYDLKVKEKNNNELLKYYEDLEFYSFIKKMNIKKEIIKEKYINVTKIEDINIDVDSAFYIELNNTHYHTANILSLSIYNKNNAYYIEKDLIKEVIEKYKDKLKYTYDLKKVYVSLKWQNTLLDTVKFDTMIASSLLDYNVKEDIANLSNQFNYDIPFYENIFNKKNNVSKEEYMEIQIKKARFIYETYEDLSNKINEKNINDLFYNIEMPLALVLGDMEYDGVNVSKEELLNMGEDIKIKLELLEKDIYNDAGCEFNISSPKQLGEILFDKLKLPYFKKNKSGYSTSADILEKLVDIHPIINKILEYRMLSKLYTTYIEGLLNSILDDGKIHTIYTQVLTRTGRLSSIEPNLQNIPVRYEYGKLIRKAFIPSDDSIIMSSDYSQIELRLLSHIANVDSLIEAFKQNIDIHTKTASDIFHVENEDVTKEMRRIAKAVNFGIIYGISGYGLSENLKISRKEAKEFIDHYFDAYPGVKEYMDETIKEAYKNGYVKTIMGRIRNIPELQNKNYMIRNSGERIALNTPIQGTSADIIKKAMVDIKKEFVKNNIKSKMIIQVHDELVFDLLKEEKEKVIEIVKTSMENVYKFNVPLKVDIEYGDNWYQAK